MRRARRWMVWMVWLGSLVLGGCVTREAVDPVDQGGPSQDGPSTATGADDADDEGDVDSGSPGGGGDGDGSTTGGTTPTPLGPAGTVYLVAVDTVVLPGMPLQYLAQVDDYDGQTVDVTFTPLSLDLASTNTPREALDEHAFSTTAELGTGPMVELDLGVPMIPGIANPITGSDLVATVVLSASTAAGGLCGTADGMVTQPIGADLAGSTFSAIPLSTDALPQDFPCIGEGPDKQCFTRCDTLGDYLP